MTRKRTRDTIIRTLCESCNHCEGKGFIKSKQTVAYEALREVEREGIERDVSKILVQAHPDVIDILAIDERDSLDQLERRYRKQIYLQAVTDFHPEQFEVSADKKEGSARRSESVEAGEGQEAPRRDRERGGRDRDRGRNRDRGGRDRDRGGDRDRNNPAREPRQIQIRPMVQNPEAGGPAAIVPRADSGESSEAPEPGNNHGPISNGSEAYPSMNAGAGNAGAGGQSGGDDAGNAAPRASGDDFYDEEDRLAFLRAQAAQDAALARLRSTGDAGNSTRPGNDRGPRGPGGGGAGGGRGGRNGGGRGRRGGGGGGGGRFSNSRGGGRDRDRGGFRQAGAGAPPIPREPGSGPRILPAGESKVSDSTSSDSGSGGGGGGSSDDSGAAGTPRNPS